MTYCNFNSPSLQITASSTPTAYALPESGVTSWRIVNNAGDAITVKAETSSTSTLTAPVSGTKFIGSTIADTSTEEFNTSPNATHISVYSTAGAGKVTIQALVGDK